MIVEALDNPIGMEQEQIEQGGTTNDIKRRSIQHMDEGEIQIAKCKDTKAIAHTVLITRNHLVVILMAFSLMGQSQCAIDFSYSTMGNNLYTFTNISVPQDTGTTITWSVIGRQLVYRSFDVQPSFYFPVNGTYYITMEVSGNTTCGGYKIDSITLSDLNATGDCQAGFSYSPSFGSQFEMTDASDASDSIVNFTWHGNTTDSFVQVNGYEKNSILSLWSYNFCPIISSATVSPPLWVASPLRLSLSIPIAIVQNASFLSN